MKFGIITDAEPNSGLGHAKRALTLTNSLISIGIHVDIYISNESKVEIFKSQKNVFKLEFNDNQNNLIQAICNRDTQLLIIDTYLYERSRIEILVDKFPNLPILAFDDYGEKLSWPIAGYINTGLAHSLINYPGRSKIYSVLGLDYYTIPEELIKIKLNTRQLDLEKRPQLLLVMGGGDPERQTIRILKILISLKIQNTFSIKVVLGPFYENPFEIIEIAKKFVGEIETIIDPDNFYQYLNESDYVITGCGTIVNELIYLRVKFAAIALSENQIPVLKEINQYGISLGYFSEISDQKIASGICDLLSDRDKKNLNLGSVDEEYKLIGKKSMAYRLAEIHKRFKGTYFSIGDTLLDYQASSNCTENYEKVKWSSKISMTNQFKLGLSLIKDLNCRKWLDVGCGTGDILQFRDVFENIPSEYTGIDISNEFISYASKNFVHYDNCIKFYNQNFIDKVVGEPFDLVTSFGVLQKCGIDLYEAINRFANLLCKRGILLISTKNLDWHAFKDPLFEPYSGHCWFTIKQLKGAFENANFKIISISGFDASKNLYLSHQDAHSVFIVGEKK